MHQSTADYLSSSLIPFCISCSVLFFALRKVLKLIIHSDVIENFNSVVELH